MQDSSCNPPAEHVIWTSTFLRAVDHRRGAPIETADMHSIAGSSVDVDPTYRPSLSEDKNEWNGLKVSSLYRHANGTQYDSMIGLPCWHC